MDEIGLEYPMEEFHFIDFPHKHFNLSIFGEVILKAFFRLVVWNYRGANQGNRGNGRCGGASHSMVRPMPQHWSWVRKSTKRFE
jgi:hypothetical protein